MIRFLSISFLLLGMGVQADSFKERTYPGAYPTKDYYGPLDTRSSFSGERREQQFFDDKKLLLSEQGPFGDELFDLDQFIKNIPSCPNITIENNYDYMRYLYRLLAMSYLYEGIKSYKTTLYQLGLDHNRCPIEYQKVLGNCQGEDPEMKKFLFRAKKVWGEDFSLNQLEPLKKSEIPRWFDSLERRKGYSLAGRRVLQSETRDLKKVEQTLFKSCSDAINIMGLLCSEKDQLFGASRIPLLTDIILESSAMRAIQGGENLRYCFERFVKVFASREAIYSELETLVPVIFNNLNRKGAKYVEGKLFVPGALKEFDDLGLQDFLYVPKAPPKKIVAKPVPVKKVAIVKVVKPLPPPPKVVTPIQKEEVKVAPAPKPVSAFETALSQIKKGSEQVKVDMSKMAKDFIFPKEMLEKLHEPLKVYQTRLALEDMKTYDGLGSSSEPARLLFIKYLIDNNFHTGLYNIQAVIGKQFYVINDIENKTEPVLVELENSQETQFKWQITLLKPNEEAPSVAPVQIIHEEEKSDKSASEEKIKKKKKLKGKKVF